jgi:hypothetical protein
MGVRLKLWDKDAERGVIWGLIVAFILLGIFGTSDTSLLIDYKAGDVPYGRLWTWLNPYYWTQQPYIFLVTLITGAIYLVEYKLMKMGKINRTLLILNLFCTVFFSATHVFQEDTTVVLGPLVSINPLFLIPMILQKFPFGWSLLPWQSTNWNCGINGVCIGFGVLNSRLDIARSDFFTHIAIVFWMAMPLMIWWRNRTGQMPFRRQLDWILRHKFLVFLVMVAFMGFLTVYAAINNGGFWNYCVGNRTCGLGGP